MRTFIEDLKSPVIESELQHHMQWARSMASLWLVQNNTVFSIAIDYWDHRTMLGEIKTIVAAVTHT